MAQETIDFPSQFPDKANPDYRDVILGYDSQAGDPISIRLETLQANSATNILGVAHPSDSPSGTEVNGQGYDVSNTKAVPDPDDGSNDDTYTNFLTNVSDGSGGFLPVVVPASTSGVIRKSGGSWEFVESAVDLSGLTPNGGFPGSTQDVADAVLQKVDLSSLADNTEYSPLLPIDSYATAPPAPASILWADAVPIKGTGTITTLNIYATKAGIVPIYILEKSGTSDLKVLSITPITLTLGLNAISVSINASDGNFIGWHTTTTSGLIGTLTTTSNGFYNVVADPAVGDIITTTGITTARGFGFGYKAYNITVKEDIEATNERIDNLSISDITNIGTTDEVGSLFSQYNSGESTRILTTAAPNDSFIKQIQVYCSKAGDIEFRIFSKNSDGTYKYLRSMTLALTLGLNVFEVGDVDAFKVFKGEYVGWYTNSGTGYIGYTQSVGHLYAILTSTTNATGANVAFTSGATVGFGIKVVLSTGLITQEIIDISKQVSELEADNQIVSDSATYELARQFNNSIGVIKDNTFYNASSIPDDWLQAGGWVPSTNGLQSPATGGWGVYAYWNKEIAIDEDATILKIKLLDTTSVFSIARISDEAKGTVGEIDFSTLKIRLYSELTAIGATPASVLIESDINFSPVLNREYNVLLKKVSENYYLTLWDSVTHEFSTISWVDTGKATTSGKCWNCPGIIFRSGSVLLLEMNYGSNLPVSPKILAVGDSILDGDTIRKEIGGGYQNRWIGLLATKLKYNVTIWARGGESTDNVAEKMPLIEQTTERPRIAIYALGTNDTVFATWQTNYLAFKSAMEAKGAIVFATTLYPRLGREAYCLDVTNYLLTSGFRYIDFAKAMTVNGDRTTRDTTLMLSDGLHPTVAGHAKMYAQALIDMADIIN